MTAIYDLLKRAADSGICVTIDSINEPNLKFYIIGGKGWLDAVEVSDTNEASVCDALTKVIEEMEHERTKN